MCLRTDPNTGFVSVNNRFECNSKHYGHGRMLWQID